MDSKLASAQEQSSVHVDQVLPEAPSPIAAGSPAARTPHPEDAPTELTTTVEVPGLQEAWNCAVCDAKLGKRVLKFRHHCRICHKSVCAACSPNQFTMQGEKSLQRACNPCVAHLSKTAEMLSRISALGEQMHQLGASDDDASMTRPTSVEGGLDALEVILNTMKDNHAKHSAIQDSLDEMKKKVEVLQTRVSDERELREELESARDVAMQRAQLAEQRASSLEVAREQVEQTAKAATLQIREGAVNQTCVKRCAIM